MAIVAVCACACSCGIEPRALRQTEQGVAADRVARGRRRANQVLALDLAEQHPIPRSGRRRQAALARRARLSGAQAGGRARTLRRPRLARLPSPRYAVHRGLRIPGLREGDDSPQDLVPLRGSRNLPYPTVTDPEDPPLRPERHIPNSIATMRRRLIAAIIKRLPRCPCCGASTGRRARANL